jgi:hypothetical protein
VGEAGLEGTGLGVDGVDGVEGAEVLFLEFHMLTTNVSFPD